MNKLKKVAVVGASGMVGRNMLKVLAERNFPIRELFLVASDKSVGKKIKFQNKNKKETYKLISVRDAIALRPDIALFSAGSDASREWAPAFAKAGATAIDNSSAWRMDRSKKLVVPEINGRELNKKDKIIANPNCSTIQMVMALAPLHKQYKIKRIVVSTYQSVTGTGKKAVDQLTNERKGKKENTYSKVYPYSIDMNVIPQIDVFLPNDYTKEEMKMVHETRKILGDQTLRITATAVRIPVLGGHSESVNVEFKKDFDLKKVKSLLAKTPGVVVLDDIKKLKYPMPKYAEGKDEVFVGRLRRDESNPKTLNMWIVADNLRKGAATNAVQIAEYLLNNNIL